MREREFTYRQIAWWTDAFHVYDGDVRMGIVNRRLIRINGRAERTVWFAHNYNFCDVRGEYATRTEAAMAIPKGPIHQRVEAFSGH